MDNLETHEERLVLRRTCFSVEPGIYLAEFGVRSEINVFVDADGQVHVTGGLQPKVVPILGEFISLQRPAWWACGAIRPHPAPFTRAAPLRPVIAKELFEGNELTPECPRSVHRDSWNSSPDSPDDGGHRQANRQHRSGGNSSIEAGVRSPAILSVSSELCTGFLRI